MSALVTWPDSVDEVFDGDQAVMLAYPTPLGGVVLTPMTNFAMRDRNAGTVTINSSIGAWRKIERIRRNPRVALAFHTRTHSATTRSEYVLVQGTASLSAPVADYPSSIGSNWERFDGPQPGPRWGSWLRVYYTRVSIEVAVERIVTWPTLTCHGKPQVHGRPLPVEQPAPQDLPVRGSAPRVDHRRAAARLARLPDLLVGWIDADQRPFVLPAIVGAVEPVGFLLDLPSGWMPAGGRRAGVTAHSFTRHVTGQQQRVHTGWLTVDTAERVHYAPHSARGHRLPPSPTLYRLAVGLVTRAQLRSARRSGLLDELAPMHDNHAR